jgi:predicted ATPase
MQWALNIKLAGDRDPDGPDHALLLTLESLISSLIPPRPLRLVAQRVESGRFELLIDTGDAVVPFDLISQGMSSIFNWIGVLLQRLYDVFPPSPDRPGESIAKPALVLIDEVDAHLHPEWQRRLVDLVRQHFPAVQVIATCHSPLIVGALERSEIVIIRDRQPFAFNEDPKGMNAEDILTGSGFGLSSTCLRGDAAAAVRVDQGPRVRRAADPWR